jgi:hypothetical protein
MHQEEGKEELIINLMTSLVFLQAGHRVMEFNGFSTSLLDITWRFSPASVTCNEAKLFILLTGLDILS